MEVDYLDEWQCSDSFVTKIDQDELIINQTICSSFSDFCTNSSFDSIINGHKYVNYDFISFDNSIEKFEKEDMNLNHSTKCCPRKEINLFQENVNESFDSHERYQLILISNQFHMKCWKVHHQILFKIIR